MSDRPRIAVITYGSLLHPADLEDLFGDIEGRVAPVKVHGFARIFNQEASWRDTHEDQRAVLNVRHADDAWFNGVLVTGLSQTEFQEYRKRERGYRLLEVESDEIERYDTASLDTEIVSETASFANHDLFLTTIGKKTRDDIQPIDEYVDLCRDGARQWGETFEDDFLRKTHLNSGISLRQHVRAD